jgi:hypothetical protein
MQRISWVAVMSWLWLASVVQADEQHARQDFAEGVQAVSEQRWEAAEAAFSRSLAYVDRPATRYNLMLVNEALGKFLEVLRHGHAFEADPRAGQHALEQTRARELVDSARRAVAILRCEQLPEAAVPLIDGAAPPLRFEDEIYVLPGDHRFTLKVGEEVVHEVSLTLQAGDEQPWPTSPPPLTPTAATTTPERTATTAVAPARALTVNAAPSPLQRRAAWSLGISGATLLLSGVVCLATAAPAAAELRTREFNEPGFPSASDRYLRLELSVMPLALTGGALLAAAIVMGSELLERGSRPWSIASLVTGGALLGFGIALMVRQPDRLVPEVDLHEPSRQLGSVVTAAALPLLAYGVGYEVKRAKRDRVRIVGVFPLYARW